MYKVVETANTISSSDILSYFMNSFEFIQKEIS